MSGERNKTVQQTSDEKRRSHGAVRQIVEFLTCLTIAVSLCKAFAVESYMIETGSMAPGFYGWHRSATCPRCDYHFALGVSPEDGEREAICPNCGVSDIAVPAWSPSGGSRNIAGDRVLVHKDFYTRRPPRRWEVAVFRNPDNRTETYVKRIVGLPGETIELRKGDLYVDGKIVRKKIDRQREMRILVHDNNYRPPESDINWQPRWQPEESASRWKITEGNFSYVAASPKKKSATAKRDWVVYRHWVRGGIVHETSVPLAIWPEGAAAVNPFVGGVKFAPDRGILSVRGAMLAATRDRLSRLSENIIFQNALSRLYEESHLAPIRDRQGYNGGESGYRPRIVRDFMLTMRLKPRSSAGDFVIQMKTGLASIDCEFHFENESIELFVSSEASAVRSVPFPEHFVREGGCVELSVVDRQATLSIDGQLIFEPWLFLDSAEESVPVRAPVRFGSRDCDIVVNDLKLYRDVYYHSKAGEAGFTPYRLGHDEYFALGDNSSISRDSRFWLANKAGQRLTGDLFIGKPFLVHLPSKRWDSLISIPDFSRIRYIR